MRAKQTLRHLTYGVGKKRGQQSLNHKQNKVIPGYVSTTQNFDRCNGLLRYSEILPALFNYFINVILDLIGDRDSEPVYLYPRAGETSKAFGSLLNISQYFLKFATVKFDVFQLQEYANIIVIDGQLEETKYLVENFLALNTTTLLSIAILFQQEPIMYYLLNRNTPVNSTTIDTNDYTPPLYSAILVQENH